MHDSQMRNLVYLVAEESPSVIRFEILVILYCLMEVGFLQKKFCHYFPRFDTYYYYQIRELNRIY